MAKAVNQNDLMDIISDQLKYTDTIINMVNESINNTIKKTNKTWKSNINIYKDIINTIFSKNGIIYDIQNALIEFNNDFNISQFDNVIQSKILLRAFSDLAAVFNIFNNLNIPKHLHFKIFIIKQQLKALASLGNDIEDASISLRQAIINRISPDGLKSTIDDISDIYNDIDGIKINPILFIKLEWIKFSIKKLKTLVSSITNFSNDISIIVKGIIVFTTLNYLLNIIQTSINIITNTKIGFKFILKLSLLKIATKMIFRFISYLDKKFDHNINIAPILINMTMLNIFIKILTNTINTINEMPSIGLKFLLKVFFIKKTVARLIPLMEILNSVKFKQGKSSYSTIIKKWMNVVITMHLLKHVIVSINHMKIKNSTIKKIKKLEKASSLLVDMINDLNNIKVKPSVNKNLEKINDILKLLKHIFANVLLVTPLAILAIPSLGVVISALWLVIKAVQLINFIIKGARLNYIKRKLRTLNVIFFNLSLVFTNIILLALTAGVVLTSLVIITATILAIIGFIKLMTILGKYLITGKTFIVIFELSAVITSLALIGLELLALALIATVVVSQSLMLLAFFGVLIVVVVAITAIGWILNFAAPLLAPALLGFGILTLAVTALFLIGVELLALQSLSLNSKKIKENVSTIIGTCKDIIEMIFHTGEEDIAEGKSKSWFRKIIEFVGGPIVNIIGAILAIPFLATTITAVGIITILGAQLNLLGKIKLDKAAIDKNVGLILDTAKSVSASILNRKDDTKPQESENTGIYKKLLNFLSPNLSTISDAIGSIGFLLASSVSVGILKNMAENLSTISNFEIKGDINKKAIDIIDTANSIISKVMEGSGGIMKRVSAKIGNKSAESLLNSLIKPIDTVVVLAKKINEIGSAKELDDKVITIDKLIDSISKLSKINLKTDKQSLLKDSIKFVEKIDKVKLTNLEKTTSMFEAMAKFSETIQGNFEGLAEALNEKIAPLLEELNEAMGKMPENVNSAAKSINSTISTNAGGPSLNKAEITENVKANNPGMSQDQVERIAQETFNRNIQKVSKTESITAEILDLLKNGEIAVKS